LRVSAGKHTSSFGPGDVGMYLTDVPLDIRWTGIDVDVLNLPRRRVEELAASRLPSRNATFKFESMKPVSPSLASYWASTVHYVQRLLADPGPEPALESDLIRAEVMAAVGRAALGTFPNTTMTAGDLGPAGQVAAAALRRAVEFIDANAEKPISLVEIAGAAGVSPRALQYAFSSSRGTTPSQYLRRVRLERAHRDLLAADATATTVACIARRWGFAKPGWFSRLYRETYGVTPSETLRR
jgi:AraC-like DNA-binding protein